MLNLLTRLVLLSFIDLTISVFNLFFISQTIQYNPDVTKLDFFYPKTEPLNFKSTIYFMPSSSFVTTPDIHSNTLSAKFA